MSSMANYRDYLTKDQRIAIIDRRLQMLAVEGYSIELDRMLSETSADSAGEATAIGRIAIVNNAVAACEAEMLQAKEPPDLPGEPEEPDHVDE